MIATREFLRLGTLVTAGTLLACANDSTAPLTPPPIGSGPVFTSIRIEGGTYPIAPITSLNRTRLEVRAQDQYGAPITADDPAVAIVSENPSVAAVGDASFLISSFNGVPYDAWLGAYVTAIAPGEAVISVSWTIGGVTRTANTTIRVESTDGWSLKFDPSTLTVKLGSATHVRATMVDADGNHKGTPQGVLFTPDRADMVALYNEELCDWQPCHGINVRGVALGEGTIAARFEGFSATMSVTVVP